MSWERGIGELALHTLLTLVGVVAVVMQRRDNDPMSTLQKELEDVLGRFNEFPLLFERGNARPVYGVTRMPLTPSVRDSARPSFALDSDHDTSSDTLVKGGAPKPSTSSDTKPLTNSGSRPRPAQSKTNEKTNIRVRTTSDAEKAPEKGRSNGQLNGQSSGQTSKEKHGAKSNTGVSACQALNGSSSSSRCRLKSMDAIISNGGLARLLPSRRIPKRGTRCRPWPSARKKRSR
uniref:Uncharacterized protein n=2 Tax=Plectus sambesii TaxID=2011161 RepID=A0A914V3A0_9BILA